MIKAGQHSANSMIMMADTHITVKTGSLSGLRSMLNMIEKRHFSVTYFTFNPVPSTMASYSSSMLINCNNLTRNEQEIQLYTVRSGRPSRRFPVASCAAINIHPRIFIQFLRYIASVFDSMEFNGNTILLIRFLCKYI